MTATEVIKQIQTLAPNERREVFAFVHTLEKQGPAGTEAVFADDASFERAADHVFAKHDGLLRKLAR